MLRKEREQETGFEERIRSAGASAAGEKIVTHDRDNDRSSDYYETKKYDEIGHKLKLQEIELEKARHELTVSKNREFTSHLANLNAVQGVNVSNRVSSDKMLNLDAEESAAISNVLPSTYIEAIRSIVVETLKNAKQ